LTADNKLIDKTPQFGSSIPTLEDLKEPDVVGEDILFEDVTVPKIKKLRKYEKFDKLSENRIDTLLGLCREKLVGEKFDYDAWNDIVGTIDKLVESKNEVIS